MILKKFLFPTLIIFLLLIVDGFLINDLQIENKKFPTFKTFDLNGNKITEKIFENKFTVMCVWTISQKNFKILSELEELQKNRKDIQIICIVGDIRFDDEKITIAKKIIAEFSPNILQLAVNDDFFPILSKIRTVPTTIFIKNGFLIGQPVGGDIKFIEKEINYIFEKNSPKFYALKKIHEIILFH